MDGMVAREYRIVGVTPLLCNNPVSMLVQGDGRPGSRIPTPEEEAASKAYTDESGRFVFPGDAIRHAIVKASSMYRAGKVSLKTYVAHIIVMPVFVPILDPESGQPVARYEVDVRRAVVQGNGVMRARPRFDRWMMVFELRFDPSILPSVVKGVGSGAEDVLLHLLSDAGQRVGLGDYRPDRGGPFGRFKVLA